MALEGKKILFLSASFFGYQEEIRRCLERLGMEVDYFDERPANSFFVKALIRINRDLLARYIDKYHLRIIEQTKHRHYDYIFITKGESISASILRKFKQVHPNAELIIYHWDSIANNHNAINTLPLFDKVFSFDKPDCHRFKLKFLPLFYLPEYKEIADSNQQRDIDLLFIGTTHSDRYQLIQKIKKQFDSKKLSCFLYMYFPSPILYYKMRFLDKSLGGSQKKEFKFESLSKNEVLKLYARSNIIADIQHPRQTGLTMRSIEVLGAKRKFITTNVNIKDYDFYCPANICVVDRDNPVIEENFFNISYKELPIEVYDKYLIDNWIKTILK